MLKQLLNSSFHKKLVAHFGLILLLATLIVGLTSFFIAQNALNEKGRLILENSVSQARDIIKTQYENQEEGFKSQAEAQEAAKEILMGPLNPDGTRSVENSVNLGQNGYFIIYDSQGNEVMHPTLEGENVWAVVDPTDKDRYLVQEQIGLAKENSQGGFITYNWYLLNSDEIGLKYSYSLYFEEWDWIVVATAYAVDFNSDADEILLSTLFLILALLVVIIYMINRYINSFTRPISNLLLGMEDLEAGNYNRVEAGKADKDLTALVDGYNKMIDYLQETDRKLQIKNKELTYLAYHDEMTMLPNYYGMKNYINSRNKKDLKGALVLINIGGLKTINALLGYDTGNEFLKEVGGFMLLYNKTYYCSRTSSNEFGIWIEKESHEKIKTAIQKLKEALNHFIQKKGYGVTSDFHLAVAVYPEHGLNFEELYEKATLVMKLLKDSSGIDSGLYRNEMKMEMEEKIKLFEELNQAFYHHELIPYYQIKMDYQNQRPVGVEALARWQSPKRGLVSPGIFLPLIGEMNLTDEFSNYMIRAALKDYHQLVEKYGQDLDLSVNVSPSSFLNTNLFDRISEYLQEFKIPYGKLILEITEDVFVSDMASLQKISRKLHEIGVRIAIDDFGTGYSSLNSLVQLEFDELKIDKSFIDKILIDEKAFEMVKILCDIAHLYHYEIVAEGVETLEQLERLKETDLKIIQGYLFSKPEAL